MCIRTWLREAFGSRHLIFVYLLNEMQSVAVLHGVRMNWSCALVVDTASLVPRRRLFRQIHYRIQSNVIRNK